ncbi:potassium channel family protein [Rhodococcus sp. ACT016]|uniref:potassium channel family protein n=1 Tax=Rhodococcus sp. ACT016 TaxID=3134808 RepID=UPI003D2D5EA7
MSEGDRLRELDRHERRRLLRIALLRPFFTVVLLVAAYFTLPMDRLSNAGAVVILVLELLLVAVLCTWQVLQIVRSPTPALRAAEALAVTLPAYLLGSATTIFLLAQMDSDAFNESLGRVDALYFTVTVFATVGFGDIVAIDETARAIVSVMMVGNLVMLAVVVKLLVEAVKWGKARRDASDEDA